MKITRTFTGPLALASVLSTVGCVGAPDPGEAPEEAITGEAESAFIGRARVPWGSFLNVRFGPGMQYGVAYQIYSWQSLNVVCYTVSPWGTAWYQLWDGNFVEGAYVRTSGFVPRCGGFGLGPGSGGGFGTPRR